MKESSKGMGALFLGFCLVGVLAFSACGSIVDEDQSQVASNATCITKQDCLSGLICADGLCAEPSGACDSSLQCPDNQICAAAHGLCVPPYPVPCSQHEDCGAAGGASFCDGERGHCMPPGAGSAQNIADEGQSPSSTEDPAPLQEEGTEQCLPEGEDCVFESSLDDACCGGFHCCPVFKICVVDWWE
jgi:hypothetical protein